MTAASPVRRFRKRPVTVEAAYWDGTVREATKVIDWALANGGTVRYHDDPPSLSIDTLEGTMTAPPGSWVIRGVAGEFYRCDPGIFERTYEPLADEGFFPGGDPRDDDWIGGYRPGIEGD